MAAGLPYAIGAAAAYPGRQIVVFTGDGSLTMQLGDFLTAVQHDLPIKIVVIKNNTLGLIKWEQMVSSAIPNTASTSRHSTSSSSPRPARPGACISRTREAARSARQAIPVHDNFNCWRSNFSVEADDVTLEDLTLLNTTPYGGSQAEAFRGNADRITLNRVNLLSYQDTIRLQGLGYVTNSYIQGDVDFTWGVGTVFWTHDELRSMHAGYVTQVRNPAGQNGYVFYRDTLTRAPGVADGSVFLGRIDPTVYPYSQAVYIDTRMDAHIDPAGWLLNNTDCSAGAHLAFWEYGSTNLQGQPVDTGRRLACSRQLTAAEAARWSDPAFVLNGWVPATVNATVTGNAIEANWSAPAGDVIALCPVHTPRCVAARRARTTASLGTVSFPLPRASGMYQVRYYANGRVAAVSAPVTTG